MSTLFLNAPWFKSKLKGGVSFIIYTTFQGQIFLRMPAQTGGKGFENKVSQGRVFFILVKICSLFMHCPKPFPVILFHVVNKSDTLQAMIRYGQGSVWSKTGTFQMRSFLCKATATLLPTRYVLTTNKNFQMMYCPKFYI